VLFLHGLGSSAADWRYQRPAFEPGYRLVLPDLPGHWRSALPPGLSVEAMAREVGALLARLGAGPAHAVGLSLGACVGLALALAEPARVRSLTLVNGFPRLPAPALAPAARLAERLALLAVAPMSAVGAHVAGGLFPEPGQEALRRAAAESLARTGRRGYWAALRALARFDASAALGRVRCPTLVVAGGRDRTVPLEAKEALARGIPGARLVLIPDAGHAANADRAEVFNRVVLDFIARR
jgi:pimeloyl-ACP methyl ester carboxylesterase